MGCKTAGFQHGDTAEVGTGKSKISAEDAQALVDKGLATEVKVVMAGKSNEVALEAKIVALETKVAELEKANEVTVAEKTALETKVAELKAFLNQSINLPKGQVPEGYEA